MRRLVVGLRMHGENTEGPVPHKPSPSHQNRRMVSGQGAGTRHGEVQPQAVVEFAWISYISFGIDALVLKATENMTTRSSDRRSEEAGTRAMPRNVRIKNGSVRVFSSLEDRRIPKKWHGRRTRRRRREAGTDGDTDGRTDKQWLPNL